MFAVGGWSGLEKPTFTFKEHDFCFLGEEPGYRPVPYMAARGMKWIQYYDEGSTVDDDELKPYLKTSYHIVSLGLTKKKQKELGLNQD